MKRHLMRIATVATLTLAGPALAGERAAAEVECAATARKLVYDCTILLTGRASGTPLRNARVSVRADMPSMPMAHTVRPVTATPLGEPGGYRATLELAMHGEWTLILDIDGPTRDRVFRKLQFGGTAVHRGHGGHEQMRQGHGTAPARSGD